MIETERECSQCGEVKPLEEGFYKSGKGLRGYFGHCKKCHSARCAENQRKWATANPEEHKKRIRRRNLKRCYGITPEDYDKMLTEQGGACAICKGTDIRGKYNDFFHVDHDHSTGKVRGLLCSPCNTALGKFQDSPEILRSAIKYLEAPS